MNQNSIGRRLTAAAILTAIILPVLNTAVLGSVTTVLASDVMIPEVISAVTGYLSELLTVASAFAAAACLSFSGASGILRTRIAWIVGLSVPAAYLAAGIVDTAFYGSNVLHAAYISYSVISCGFELFRYALVLILALLIARAGAGGTPHEAPVFLSAHGTLSLSAINAAGATGLSMLLTNITETLSLLMRVGAPVNTSETLTLVSPYITTVIFTILGYFLSYFLHKSILRAAHGHSTEASL